MKTRTVMLSEIFKNPKLSLLPSDYVNGHIYIAPEHWIEIAMCRAGDCQYCQAIAKKTRQVLLDPQDEGVYHIPDGYIKITEQEYNYIKMKGQ